MEQTAITEREACALRSHVHRFLRSFGMLAAGQTPCGEPLPVSHAHALMILKTKAQEGQTLSMGDLARRLMIDKSNVTRLCRRMLAEGHIQRLSSSADRRVKHLKLTPSGQRLAKQVEAKSRQRFQRIVQSMSREECSGLLRGLEALNRAVQQTKKEFIP